MCHQKLSSSQNSFEDCNGSGLREHEKMMSAIESEEAYEEKLRMVQEERSKMQEESRLLEAEKEWRSLQTPYALCEQNWAKCAKLESQISRQQLSSHEETLADAASLVVQERRLEEQERERGIALKCLKASPDLHD